MANPTTNFGWVMPTATDLVTDLPADFDVFGQAVDTSLAQLKGGTTGQVLSKTSATNMAFTWVTPTDQTPLTTKGDLFTFSTVDARLGVGTNGQVLVADSTAATGLKWASAGGKVLQVVSANYSTATSSSSATYADTGLTASITPSATNSKILVMVHQNGCFKTNQNATLEMNLKLLRGATDLASFGQASTYTGTAIYNVIGSASITYLDSPATVSATTYKTTFNNPAATAQVGVQNASTMSTITLIEIGA